MPGKDDAGADDDRFDADTGDDGFDDAVPSDGNPFVDGRAATRRDASAGPLFDDGLRPGETGVDPGLVGGGRDDPLLVAGVGYPLLGDLAVGTVVAYRVVEWDLPGVAVADCSHTPVAAYQTITDGDYESLLLVGAEKRGGELNDGTPSETPGAVHEYDATAFEVGDDDVVERIGESAMGSNTVENVVAVTRRLGELPGDATVLTVEPGYDSWGTNVTELTDPVADALPDVLERVLDHVESATNAR